MSKISDGIPAFEIKKYLSNRVKMKKKKMGKRKPKKGKKKRKIRTRLVFSDVHWNAIDDVLNFERLGELISRDS
jgi:hypothetical protein